MSATRALTVIAPIAGDRRAALDAALAALQANVGLAHELLPATHFTRFAILEDPPAHPAPLPAMLAWESNHDGSAEAYIERVLVEVPAVDAIFAACEGYPAGTDLAARRAWVQAHAHRAAAYYSAYRGITRGEVINDGAVHAALREIVDAQRAALREVPPHEIQRRLCAEVRARHPALGVARTDGAAHQGLVRLRAAAELLAILPVILVILGPWYLLLRAHEARDRAAALRARSAPATPVHDHRGHRADEDIVRQNQLTHVVDIKPGAFRLFTVWMVLTVIDMLARAYFVHGALGGITSIHFARWVIVRDRRAVPRRARRHRLVFFSNYDGSWESYLGEFIDRAATGLTAVWSNTVGFPPSKALLWEGAADEETFKQWTRDHQLASQVWWSGVPTATVQNVRDDIWLRRHLDQTLTHTELATWLYKI